MLKLTKLNDHEILLNEYLIEFVEAVPDTTITLATGNVLVVKEKMEEICSQSGGNLAGAAGHIVKASKRRGTGR